MTRRTNFLRIILIVLTITNTVSGVYWASKICWGHSACHDDHDSYTGRCRYTGKHLIAGACVVKWKKKWCSGTESVYDSDKVKDLEEEYGGDFMKMCAWTLRWGCPGQPGSPERAGNDGTGEYQCCCDHKYYIQPMCAAYMATTGCAWTKTWGCPGQSSPKQAGDDGSVGYKCCCEAEHWKTV